jgi:hypothetical protein
VVPLSNTPISSTSFSFCIQAFQLSLDRDRCRSDGHVCGAKRCSMTAGCLESDDSGVSCSCGNGGRFVLANLGGIVMIDFKIRGVETR